MKGQQKSGSLRELIPLALPIFLSHAIDISMIFCDRLFLSQLGKEHLAATLTGGILTFLFSTLMIGTFGQIAPLAAQYAGAARRDRCIRVVHQGLIAAVVLPPLFLAAAWISGPRLFQAFGHDPALAALESDYFRLMSLTVVTTAMRTVFANFFIGIGKSAVVTAASLAAVIVNLPLAYGFIFGKFGLPALGMEGAALGTVLASCVPVLILGAAFSFESIRSEYNTYDRITFDGEIMRKMFRYGLPAGLEMLVNVSGFMFFTMIMFSYSPEAAAATTIVLNWDMVCFVPLMGLSQAVGSLVGRYLGAEDPESAKRAAWSSLKAGWVHAALISVAYFTFTDSLVHPFLDNASDATAPLAITMLKISCVYFFFDATYAILGGILKGAGDTVWTMLVSNGLMWGMAGLVYAGREKMGLTPVGAWLILTGLVFCLGTVFGIRFLQGGWLLRRMIH